MQALNDEKATLQSTAEARDSEIAGMHDQSAAMPRARSSGFPRVRPR